MLEPSSGRRPRQAWGIKASVACRLVLGVYLELMETFKPLTEGLSHDPPGGPELAALYRRVADTLVRSAELAERQRGA